MTFPELVSLHFTDRLLRIVSGCLVLLSFSAFSSAQELSEPVPQPRRWAVILVGLPGDEEHRMIFRETAGRIRNWLITVQQIPASQVVMLPATGFGVSAPSAEAPNQRAPGVVELQAEASETQESAAVAAFGTGSYEEVLPGTGSDGSLTAESIRSLFVNLRSKLRDDDALWFFTLGHGNYDGRRAWFHVAGRDPSDLEFAEWLAELRCQEQVIWLTHSCSGWFVRSVARPGRIVIAATEADDEVNETEFPHAFATVADWSVSELDSNQDNAVSVAEFHAAVVKEVERRFQVDQRLPTEHAQLNDSGGDLADRTLIPFREVQPIIESRQPCE